MSAPAVTRPDLPHPEDDEPLERAPRRAPRREEDDAPAEPRRRRFGWRALVGLFVLFVVLAAAASSPWWAPRALTRLAYFRVRRVEIEGARYAPPAELLARLRVDTTWSVWSDLDALAKRVEKHPLIAAVRVERQLPGTLRLIVREREPVAMAPTRGGVTILAADGRVLPIDPSLVGGVDVPVLAAADPAALRVLDALRHDAPTLYARVSEMRRAGRDELRMTVTPDARAAAGRAGDSSAVGANGGGDRAPFVLRASPDVSVERFADLLPVERDLARRRVRVAEIDLRFRDQVIARLP
jgi:cell division protein FtsQ